MPLDNVTLDKVSKHLGIYRTYSNDGLIMEALSLLLRKLPDEQKTAQTVALEDVLRVYAKNPKAPR